MGPGTERRHQLRSVCLAASKGAPKGVTSIAAHDSETLDDDRGIDAQADHDPIDAAGMTVFDAAARIARPDVVAAFERVWGRISRPGAVYGGSERVAIAAVARAARSGDALPTVDLPPAAIEAARVLGGEPAMATEDWVAGEIAPAIGYPAYVEIIGIAAQLTAVDTFHRAMGLDLEPLPEPVAGEPDGTIAENAKLRSSWVPTDGPGSVVYALSLVPGEMAGFEDLHGPLYIPVAEMGNDLFARSLQRHQMELVAARTSALNDCFY